MREIRSRVTETQDLLKDLESFGQPGSMIPPDGSFSAAAMLIVDSTLSADEEALTVMRDGLRRLVSLRDRGDLVYGTEEYGRLRSLLIGATTGLVRVAPPKTGRRKIVNLPGI